jgi:NADPH-dependent stearoyl-CoA 9-desaturase
MSDTTEAMIENPLARLSDEEIEEIGREFQEIHDEVFASLGDRDANYIRTIIALHRQLALLSRAILLGSRYRPAWVLGTSVLGISKILENMEIGHNILHGQWDWMQDPRINSASWDWDTASPAESWKHSHNYIHHTFTNIRGKDKDLGYEIMRIDPHQPWNPVYLLQPVYNLILAAFFEWGVAVHDLDIEAIRAGNKDPKQLRRELRGIGHKAWRQVVKDYIAFPALSGPKGFKSTLAANFTANIIRNVWSYSIIFCGHFPDQTYTFSQEETENETVGAFYLRQLLGAANIEGSPVFHVMSGNLGYQVEHHLYPDMPSSRYGQIAPKVKAICERHGLPYNTGPFSKQLGSVQRTIVRLAFPGGKPRPKPGPFHFEQDREQAPLIAV